MAESTIQGSKAMSKGCLLTLLAAGAVVIGLILTGHGTELVSLALALLGLYVGGCLSSRERPCVLGTGVMPVMISGFALRSLGQGGFHSLTVSGQCPECGAPVSGYGNIARDYLTLLYVPLFPLFRMSCLLDCGSCGRAGVALPAAESDVWATSSVLGRSDVMSSWWLPTLFALAGGLAGWFWLSPLLGHGLPGLCVGAAAVVLYVPLFIVSCASPAQSDGYRLVTRGVAATLGIVLTLTLNPSYSQIAGAVWGMALAFCLFEIVANGLD